MADPSDAPPWATLLIRLDATTSAGPDGGIAFDKLESIGTLLALDDDVTGVETRDPTAAGCDAETPELVVYTHPDALERLQQRALDLAQAADVAIGCERAVHCGEAWRDVWKRFYEPMVFGNPPGPGSLLLRPSWIARRPGDPERELVLDPGRAFGTGLHATTRLCLERLCTLADAGVTATTMLDLGCGSGILALAAARLFDGLHRIVAIDFDAEASATALENAELNGLHERMEVHTGTLADLPANQQFDLVTANIRTEVLVPIATHLRQRITPGGRAILSGILEEEIATVAQAYAAARFETDHDLEGGEREMGIWRALDLRNPEDAR
jgi:ribosomal protein L11 methyltransferase